MSGKGHRSPSESPPQLTLPWMNQGIAVIDALATSPTRSGLLQASSRTTDFTHRVEPLVAPAQESRLQIADIVK